MTDRLTTIKSNVERILQEIPEHVTLVAAGKTRSPEEVEAAVQAGLQHVGHNYVQEAQSMIDVLGDQVQWHMIGHLQRNKAKVAVALFDMIESLDSWRLAKELEKRCAQANKTLPVLIEINSGSEGSKTGVLPKDTQALVEQVSELPHLRIQGLMTMGPAFGDPENARPYFQATRQTLERLARLHLPNVEMHILSMGMSNSYRVAIEEGATMIRLGTILFGERQA